MLSYERIVRRVQRWPMPRKAVPVTAQERDRNTAGPEGPAVLFVSLDRRAAHARMRMSGREAPGSATTLRPFEGRESDGLMRRPRGSAKSEPPALSAFFLFYPFLHFVDFIKEPATNLRARRTSMFVAPALQRPRAAAQHCSKTKLTDKSLVADNDLVASSGRRFGIGNRWWSGVRGRPVRQPLVLTRHRQRTVGPRTRRTSFADVVARASAGSASTLIRAGACRSRKASSRVCQRSGWSRSHSFLCRGDNLPM